MLQTTDILLLAEEEQIKLRQDEVEVIKGGRKKLLEGVEKMKEINTYGVPMTHSPGVAHDENELTEEELKLFAHKKGGRA